MRGVAVVSPRLMGAGCDGSVFQFELSTPAPKVELLLMTVAERRVASLEWPGKAGFNVYCWDGRDSEAHEAARGVYLYRERHAQAAADSLQEMLAHWVWQPKQFYFHQTWLIGFLLVAVLFMNRSFFRRRGQTVALIGSTGAGKTTLVSLIPRLFDATGGTVRVGGGILPTSYARNNEIQHVRNDKLNSALRLPIDAITEKFGSLTPLEFERHFIVSNA